MSAAYLPHYEWAAVLGLSLALWCFGWVMPRFGAVPAALLGVLGLNTIWVWVWVENRYLPLNPYDQMALRYFSADSLLRLLIVIVPLMLLAERRESLRYLGIAVIKAFVVLNSLWVSLGLLMSGCREINSCGGVGNPSIMVGLTVCMLPLVVISWRKNWITLLLAAVAVVASKSSVALGLAGLYGAYLVYQANPRLFGMAACVAVVPLCIGFFTLRADELFNTGDRFLLWQYMMPKWAAPQNLLFGTGFGTYHVFSINLQHIPGVHPPTSDKFWWDSLHNEWLEMLFVGGIASAALMLGTYFKALSRMVRQEFDVAMSIFLFGLYMFMNPALHHAIPALFGAWLFVYALKKDGFHIKRPLYY